MKGRTVYLLIAWLEGAAMVLYMALLTMKYGTDGARLTREQPAELAFYLFAAGVLAVLGLFMLELVKRHYMYAEEWE
ncbi:hypothetical protein [Paenibacillus gansuensis]|uniref:Uncharacterized protein n=1 Tax=Paenibacillus gansuensis TaxID=306542 RepID=A0ABW5P6F4_9BACL